MLRGTDIHTCCTRASITTYIFVAVFVSVIMLVAVPAREKVVRQGRGTSVIDAACTSRLMRAEI